jgi:hypothetical protein
MKPKKDRIARIGFMRRTQNVKNLAQWIFLEKNLKFLKVFFPLCHGKHNQSAKTVLRDVGEKEILDIGTRSWFRQFLQPPNRLP